MHLLRESIMVKALAWGVLLPGDLVGGALRLPGRPAA